MIPFTLVGIELAFFGKCTSVQVCKPVYLAINIPVCFHRA